MERPLALRPLNIQDENVAVNRKKSIVDGKSKSSKPIPKKGGAALESRKALNDITNKSSIHDEASSLNKGLQKNKSNIVKDGCLRNNVSEAEVHLKKKTSLKEKVNIAEEGFLHDHSKCVEAQKASMELNFWDTVLPGHDSADWETNEAKSDVDIGSVDCYTELEELSMSEFFVWFESPPSSPTLWDSPTFDWDLHPVELVLKEEDECHVK
ncbi:hypothetical protein ACJIZ3_012047 [Penstemon smallii]|uniref:Uncharacterized protein n=1 Tax=Penstemon smallii TaxID=265156 RepID=A0ABD3UPG9_9LAMI